jgi:hypothetical protein
VRFLRNAAFEASMQRDPRYRAYLRARVEAQVVPVVRGMAEQVGAPWMPRGGRAIVTESDLDGVRVVNTDYGAHLAEWGSVNNPPHAPLRRGVRAAGLRLREE